MLRRHFSYLAGFLFIWLVWAASFGVAVGAVVVGLVCYLATRALEGDLDLSELSDRFTSGGRRR
jgi:protein-S-isoprenylcysteine O-methyltransferase Ste14